jgi:hypothetical protein
VSPLLIRRVADTTVRQAEIAAVQTSGERGRGELLTVVKQLQEARLDSERMLGRKIDVRRSCLTFPSLTLSLSFSPSRPHTHRRLPSCAPSWPKPDSGMTR